MSDTSFNLNLNLFFNKTIYKNLDVVPGKDELRLNGEDMEHELKKLYNYTFIKEDYNNVDALLDKKVKRLYFKVGYPGLAVGLGYAHGVSMKSDVKLGFSFDYVSGQPYIPGSSVKGVLRHYLENDDVFVACFPDENKENKKDFINYLFGEDDERTISFLDAVIKHGDKEGGIIGSDFITPHDDKGLKNPTPLQFVKILPDVVMEFRFIFSGSDKGSYNICDGFTVTVDELLHEFSDILTTFGIGAKTNVGYGVLTEISKDDGDIYPQKRRELSEPQRSQDNRDGGRKYNNQHTGQGSGQQRYGKGGYRPNNQGRRNKSNKGR